MLHASHISIFAAPIVYKAHLLSSDVDLPRCGERMQRMHAIAGKRVGGKYSDWCALQILWVLEEQHPLLSSWGVYAAIFDINPELSS